MAFYRATASLVAMIIYLHASHAYMKGTSAAGLCLWEEAGERSSHELEPMCGGKSPTAKVPPACCARVGALLRSSHKCLCAVFLSPLVKKAGINPAIAITVPKRCNIKGRPVGKKCGRKILCCGSL